jgi:riboflavin synthase
VFTGIVEHTVRISAASEAGSLRRLSIPSPWEDVALGQSIAVNGCCLTVAAISGSTIDFDVVAETLAKTNLGRLSVGDEVHLERSLRLQDRLDGHIVQGHIDGVAPLLDRQDDGQECRLTVGVAPHLSQYIVPKGSVALDGVSLTVASVGKSSFTVALIPTTLNVTALGRRRAGWLMNLETDILNKTVVFWLERQANLLETRQKKLESGL